MGRVDAALRLGAKEHGFKTDLWTLPRIGKVIEQLTGVKHHPGHVWRILHRLDWSLPRPARRARKRNEEAVRQWVSTHWSGITKKRENFAAGSTSKARVASRSGPPSGAPGRPGAKRRF
ncbi:MAG: helix-turn-helix domain-containing protein [Spirochaetia bacterium]